ncbi:glycoside hydrolase family 13 protein [Lacticaseibacillus zeae]|uniref:Glycoside hydrolase family 13 protein n=1 Tax=Lacticaseibacillus zeae TaxID=57037 RepID=A0A5R8LTM5_LACZE|nr:glycoside hydrolase family 13 protein [Lacticaseibacillus zeae]TLF40555.1 glycoside hydrolase family 13 protein [Lacticaseibacillus zeae]
MFQFDSFTDRRPFGAVREGTLVHFSAKADGAVTQASLVIAADGQWDQAQTLPMTQSPNGYTVTFTPPSSGLWFYHFELQTDEGRQRFGAVDGGYGGLGQTYSDNADVVSYQLTVVHAFDPVPAWYKNARFYHIFVDRFQNGNADGHVNAPKANSFIYGRQSDRPMYIRGNNGEVLRWDFYGGNLAGIQQKLPLLAARGINALYLSPIFQARSNHRYDTGDYYAIDEVLGTLHDFKQFLAATHRQGMHVILDGVFNHVGADSRYFNAVNEYNDVGAANSLDSPYASWFSFKRFPDDYNSWWGVKDLPAINKDNQDFHNFIAAKKDSVISYWTDMGIDGWRLDVADELTDDFIRQIRSTLDQFPDRVLIGEVWEDASNKQAYGKRRQYFEGGELNAVMNYPLRSMLIDFVNGQLNAAGFVRQLMTLKENYPPNAFDFNFNNIGTHDTPRILTVLNGDRQKLKLLVSLFYWLPGVTCLYYGDEAGLTGGKDPDNRAFYPWGHEDQEIMDLYQIAIQTRIDQPALAADAAFFPFTFEDSFGFVRQNEEQTLVVLANPTCSPQALQDANTKLVPANLRSLLPVGTMVPPCSVIWQEL